MPKQFAINNLKAFYILTGLFFISEFAVSQDMGTTLGPPCKPIPLAPIREKDVMWRKRIWRIIDLREKINLTLYYPATPNATRKSLWDVISNALTTGKIKAYSFDPNDLDDCWSAPLTPTEVNNKIHPVDTVTDPDTGEKKTIHEDVTSDLMKQYMLKEDWIFDNKRSVMDVRIVGMVPCKAAINENTHREDPNAKPVEMFWVYFPDLRYFLCQPMFNAKNDAEWRTLDDIFIKRQFSSYVFQEDNVYDRTISAYLTNSLDALLKGKDIENDIFAIEHDMWQY